MFSMDMGIIFLTQTGVGFLGNFSLLCLYNFTLFTRRHLRPTDLILNQLVLANSIVLLSKGVPQTLASLGWKHFLDDRRCKLVFYFYRVSAGVSFSTLCLFNGFQAITLNPESVGGSLQKGVMATVPGQQNIVRAPYTQSLYFSPDLMNFGCCAVRSPRRQFATLYSALLASTDVLCLGLMMWASGSMVFVLSRHKKRVQHIHRSLPSRSVPESRATHSILTLVSSFVLSYSTSTILTTYMALLDGATRWLVHINVAMAACFPAFCPFLLLSHYNSVSRLCSGCCCQLTNCPGTVREL
uniref:Vomeronasal type-1 receptor n=1 Tax=Sciurus vulgaris TaxID=55149 RepID=A0A8D2JNB4_SCIVU